MRRSDEVVNVVFMLGQKGMDVGLIDELGALCLGKDEVGENDEPDERVEWEPRCC